MKTLLQTLLGFLVILGLLVLGVWILNLGFLPEKPPVWLWVCLIIILLYGPARDIGRSMWH